jgi:predicted secreted hydrolase
MTTDNSSNTESTSADPAQDLIPARRRFMARGAAIGAGGAVAGLSATAPAAAQSPAGSAPNAILPSGFPARNLGSSRESLLPMAMSTELVVTTPQPVYVLPRDHKFHSGQFYANNQYWEWHYWSGFCKDAEGNDYALFFGTDPVGYDPKTGGFGFLPAVFSISPIKEGRKYHYFNNFPSFEARLPADSTSPADFQYLLRNDEAGWTVDERYYANDERWMFTMRSKNPADPWCDLDIRVGAPGYIPRTPTGIEEEGFNDQGRYNPQTMHGLSYYYIAPNMPFTGKVGFAGRTVEVKGSVWLEHQWGNIKGMDQENCRWRWFSFRFDDGRMMAFRHWVLPPDNLPVHDRNHFCMIHPDGRIEYGFPNREMRFTPTRSFSISGVDAQWNPEGLMETPFGNFFLKSLVDDSVFVSKTGMTFWEGPMLMLEGSSAGKRIGMAYVEQYFQPRGGPTLMRTLPEQDLAREMPIAGIAPKSKR